MAAGDSLTSDCPQEKYEHDLGPNSLKAVAFICSTALGIVAAIQDGQDALIAVVALAAGISGLTGYAVGAKKA